MLEILVMISSVNVMCGYSSRHTPENKPHWAWSRRRVAQQKNQEIYSALKTNPVFVDWGPLHQEHDVLSSVSVDLYTYGDWEREGKCSIAQFFFPHLCVCPPPETDTSCIWLLLHQKAYTKIKLFVFKMLQESFLLFTEHTRTSEKTQDCTACLILCLRPNPTPTITITCIALKCSVN